MSALKSLIQQHNLTAKVIGGAHRPSGWEQPTRDYRIRLRLDNRSMELDFFTGLGWTRQPDADDVMECLASDAASIENANSFEEWAREFGLDMNDDMDAWQANRKWRRTYNQTVNQTTRLRQFLGEHYHAFVWGEMD